MRFDFTGFGVSDGEFASAGFWANTTDLIAAIEWLKDEHATAKILVDHPLGSAAVLSVAGDVPGVRAVVTLSAPADTQYVTGLLDESSDKSRRRAMRVSGLQAAVHYQAAVPRRPESASHRRTGCGHEEGGARDVSADRQHDRDRQRCLDLCGSSPPEQRHLARRC
ncbi:MAG: hypothetical protein GKR86_05795 [Ilumatobacter sp.]|nr:hypothetical protein [Ilumatobacter sp.]